MGVRPYGVAVAAVSASRVGSMRGAGRCRLQTQLPQHPGGLVWMSVPSRPGPGDQFSQRMNRPHRLHWHVGMGRLPRRFFIASSSHGDDERDRALLKAVSS